VNVSLLIDGLTSFSRLTNESAWRALEVPVGELVEQIADDSGFADRELGIPVFTPEIDLEIDDLINQMLSLGDDILFGDVRAREVVAGLARRAQQIVSLIAARS
jgi:hypothetical protein